MRNTLNGRRLGMSATALVVALAGAASVGVTGALLRSSGASGDAASPEPATTGAPTLQGTDRGATPPAWMVRALRPAVFDNLTMQQQEMVLRRMNIAIAQPERVPAQACFAEGTSDAIIEAFHAPHGHFPLEGVGGGGGAGNPFGTRYSPGSRWDVTALTPIPTPEGQPVTLTWSVIPDGTMISSGVGEPEAGSDFRVWADGVFGGGEATWRPILRSVFDRWAEVSGLRFVEELNDDGATFVDSPGVVGVRGDLRIGGKFIDGNGGVLAYNYFPQSGDMVFDTADANFNSSANDYRFFRNVMSHEHGHGMGLGHSCPVTRTKMMEPFINTGYDGPQFDDVRGAHNFYGDTFEPSSLAAPVDLGAITGPLTIGAVPSPAINFGAAASLHDGADVDAYALTASGPTLLRLTLTPQGMGTYGTNRQACGGYPGSCCVEAFSTASDASTLRLRVFDASGSVLSDRVASGAGAAVESAVYLPAGGQYRFEISASASNDDVQLYTLGIAPTGAPVLASASTPDLLTPGVATPVEAVLSFGGLAMQSVRVLSSVNGGAFVPSALVSAGDVTYSGTMPTVSCGDVVEYFYEAVATGGQTSRLPATGVLVARVGAWEVASLETFEADTGWTVSGNATAGVWVREEPVGTAGQPEFDTTPDSGEICWVTGNAAPGSGDGVADVDGGETILTSPLLSIAGLSRPRLSMQVWYSNGTGTGAYNDTAGFEMRASESDAWTPAITLGPGGLASEETQPGWRTREIDLAALSLTSSTVQVRYRVSDTGAGSLVEGALDDVAILSLACTPPAGCDGIDFNNDGLFPDDADLIDFLSVFAGGSCSTGNTCNDIDFNNDDLFPDDGDLVAFLRVLAGGSCE